METNDNSNEVINEELNTENETINDSPDSVKTGEFLLNSFVKLSNFFRKS
jgi:hypothetical protein